MLSKITKSYLTIFIIYLIALYPVFGFVAKITFDMSTDNIMFFPLILFSILIFIEKEGKIIFPRYLLFYFLFVLFEEFAKYYSSHGLQLSQIFKNRFIETFLMFFLIENSNLKILKKKYIIKSISFIVFTAFIVIIIQTVYKRLFFMVAPESKLTYQYIKDYDQRLYSIFSWNGRALTAGFGEIPMAALLISHYLNNNKQKLAFLFLFVAVVFAFLAKSRWIMLNSVLLFFIFLKFYKNDINKKFAIIILVSLFSFLVFIFISYLGISVDRILKYRILQVQYGGIIKGSASTRFLAFKLFKEFFPKAPILGNYFKGGSFTELNLELAGRSSQIHVGYLSLFYLFGIVGGILFILFLYYLLKDMYRVARETNDWGFFYGFLGFAIANFTLVIFYSFYSGLILCHIFYVYNKEKIKQKNLVKQKNNGLVI